MEDIENFRNGNTFEKRKTRRMSLLSLASLDMSFRKRKRRSSISSMPDEDAVSIQSLDTTKKKSRRSLLKVSSLANLLSPVREKMGEVIQLSSSFKVPRSPAKRSLTPYKAPQPSPAKLRLTHTWSDMMALERDSKTEHKMSNQDIKQQEAIYELYRGELNIIEDLLVVKQTYCDSMKKLRLLSDGELKQIFGPIEELIPIHRDLVERLQNQRLPDGTTQAVGQQLLDWIPSLSNYVDFCGNQVFAKALLDEKKNDPSVDDFLQRCQDSPFSRKLDLWSLLDGARSRFMKYPLLMKSIQKYTKNNVEDSRCLESAIKLAENIISKADLKTGQSNCSYYKVRLIYLYEDQNHPAIEESTGLLCSGVLKNNKGSKLHVFLFDKILVITRPVVQNGQQYFQVYRQPIPTVQLTMEDLQDGEFKMGSFRNVITQGQAAKNAFRISFQEPSKGQSHTLLANSEHDKQQWMQHFKKVAQTTCSIKKHLLNERAS